MARVCRQLRVRCRALALCSLAATFAVTALAANDYRLAAVINTESRSMALIEMQGGDQSWFRVGDTLGESQVAAIDGDGVTLSSSAGSYRLLLRGEPGPSEVGQPTAPERYQSRQVQFLGLLSRINAVTPEADESYEQAVGRNMNHVLGLGSSARITAIDREPVSSAEQAQRELQRRLAHDDPIQISVENGDLDDLYVVPEYPAGN